MINHVKMINWRAYDEHEVSFDPGITFIMGANGIGKTSILEAIAYALTGEPSTVKNRGKLLRNPDKQATVQLTFTAGSQTYLVERTQSLERAEGATLVRLGDGKQLASSHKGVTQQIEKLMGVSADFLQRIVYMAEGDVFRFLDHPPGKELHGQICQFLGLTQLDQFADALGIADKEIKSRIGDMQGLLADLERLGVRQNPDFEYHIGDMDKHHEQLLTDLRSVENEVARHKYEREDLERLAQLVDRALSVLQQESNTWQTAQREPALSLLEQTEQRLQGTQVAVQQYQLDLARLEGEKAPLLRIHDVLKPYAGQAGTLPCPVCSKPMTTDEREIAIHDIQATMRRIAEEARSLNSRRAEAERTLDRLKTEVERLRELREVLVRVRFQWLSADMTIADLAQVIRSRQVDLAGDLQERAGALKQQIVRLEDEKAEYLAARRRLQNLGWTSPEEASEALVELEVRSLSLRAAKNAVQETLTTQENVDMKAILDQVARVWGTMSGAGNWRVQLDSKGMPQLEDGEGHRLDLSQLSGGEKTALLIMLHTIIAQHFSNSDFLLIDEPLEHLDPVNRRSLIRFLVSSYRRGGLEQAIVATFEESLIRKYMSEEGVNVIHL